MKVISLPETAFEVLTAANGTMTFAELYGKVAEIAEMSEEEKAARIGQFYTDISLDEMLFEFFERLVRNLTGTDNTLQLPKESVAGLGKATLNCRK